MTLSDINNKISFLTKSDTGSYPNADRLISLNEWLNNITVMILLAQDEWDYDDSNKTDLPILTNNIISGQSDYTLPSGILDIKRVEISYDNGSTWYESTPIDSGEPEFPLTGSTTASYFDKTKPRHDVQYGSIFIYPAPLANSTGGLKLWISRDAIPFNLGDLTTGTLVPGFQTSFHNMLAYGAALDYAVANSLPSVKSIAAMLESMKQSLQLFYGRREKDRELILVTDYQNYK